MKLRYRIGNGPAGNVGAETIRHLLIDSYSGLDGTLVLGFAGNRADVAVVRNVIAATGGTAMQSVSETRRLAPVRFQDPQRAVTPADYARFATSHRRVAAARAVERWTGSWSAIVLLLDLVDGDRLDDALEAEIRAFLEPYRLAGHALEFRDAKLVPLEIVMRVCVADMMPVDAVDKELRALFSSQQLDGGKQGLFHPDRFSFGSQVQLSRLYAAAHSVPGVRHAEITHLRRQGESGPSAALESGVIAFGEYEIPILENSRNHPDRGRLTLTMEGGI